MNQNNHHLELAYILADQFNQSPQVIAVALSGSVAAGNQNPGSDIDLYVFTTSEVPLHVRQTIVQSRGATRADLDLHFWDPGDEWLDAPTGIEVDIMYWDKKWIEDRIDHVLTHHRASMGYSTCTWYTIRNARILFDRSGWLKTIQEKSMQPYPLPLQQAIIQANYPVLRDVIPAYLNQIEKALQRKDLVSINHRIAALLASYFDIVYAINRVLQPGEKRLLDLTPKLCPLHPPDMVGDIEAILTMATTADHELIKVIHHLIDELDEILATVPN